MKISKLFHWLYAFLMFLPILVFLPTLLYFGINKYVQPQSSVEEVYEYLDVDFNQHINFDNGYSVAISGDTYSIDYDNNTVNISFTSINSNLYPTLWRVYSGFNLNDKIFIRTPQLSSGGNIGLRCFYNGTVYYKTWYNTIFTVDYDYDYFDMYSVFLTSSSSYQLNFNVSFFNLTQMFGAGNEPTIAEFNDLYPNVYYPYTQSQQETLTIDTGTTESFINIGNEVQYSINSMWDFRIFSWAKNSFLALPITYVTGLFGLASTNVVNYYLSYWLAVSIIYLVFDLIMYVPLLVHRWIDKGMLE